MESCWSIVAFMSPNLEALSSNNEFSSTLRQAEYNTLGSDKSRSQFVISVE